MRFNTALLNMFNSDIKQKVIMYYFTHDISMSERELASILKISHMSINRIMHEFEEMNLATYIRAGNSHLWRFNKQSYSYNALFKIFQSMYSVKKPLDDLITTIIKNIPGKIVEKVILFGSIPKKNEKSDSDIDIFVLIKKNKNQDMIKNWLNKLSEICLSKYGNRLAPYILTYGEFRKKQKLKIIREINQGIQVYPKK